ncbi:hypothetical protein RUM43_012357, partial [Polyplax serrata]
FSGEARGAGAAGVLWKEVGEDENETLQGGLPPRRWTFQEEETCERVQMVSFGQRKPRERHEFARARKQRGVVKGNGETVKESRWTVGKGGRKRQRKKSDRPDVRRRNKGNKLADFKNIQRNVNFHPHPPPRYRCGLKLEEKEPRKRKHTATGMKVNMADRRAQGVERETPNETFGLQVNAKSLAK